MDKYKNLIVEISKHFKSLGWSKQSDTFYLQNSNNWGVVNFQRADNTLEHSTKFTINLGVSSVVIREFNEENVKLKPSIWDCHWRQRIGFFMPANKDFWWEIDNDTNIIQLASNILNIISTTIIPEIEKHLSDNNLIQTWMNGEASGLTELQRYINLSILLKFYNEKKLNLVIEEMKNYSNGKPFSTSVKVHLKQLGIS